MYCRFCDDMILIGTQQNVVKDVFNAYNQAVIYSLFALHPNKKIAKIKCTNKKQKGNTKINNALPLYIREVPSVTMDSALYIKAKKSS